MTQGCAQRSRIVPVRERHDVMARLVQPGSLRSAQCRPCARQELARRGGYTCVRPQCVGSFDDGVCLSQDFERSFEDGNVQRGCPSQRHPSRGLFARSHCADCRRCAARAPLEFRAAMCRFAGVGRGDADAAPATKGAKPTGCRRQSCVTGSRLDRGRE